MKKLTVLLAAVMAFAFSASAYAATPSDLAEQSATVQDAFAKTMALGIINGYEDGTVGPEQNITRAEFAKIAVTAAGAKDTADMLANNNSSFKDVKAGQWYTGWINASESLGIFQGDGNGNFRPNDTITNQEVITVLMRLLGYNDNLTGTWPVNYVTQANKESILDDVAIVAAAPATRADVVVMLDATMDTNIVTYDKDTNEFVEKQYGVGSSKAKTLLADSFKGAYYTVNSDVNEKSFTGTSFDGVTDVRDTEKQTLNWGITNGGSNVIIDADTRVSYNGGSLFDLAGHQGKVYYVTENDKKYARFIEVESYTKTVTDAPSQSATGEKLTVNKTNYNTIDTALTTSTSVDLTTTSNSSKYSNYILYFNDDDQVYAVKSDKDLVKATGEGKTYYVKSINNTSMKLVGNKTTTVSLADDILVYTDNGFIAATDLKAGDAIQYVDDDLYIKVEDTTGTLTKSVKDSNNVTKATIGGKSYVYVDNGIGKLDKEFETDNTSIADLYNTEVSFVLNKSNDIAAMIISETGSSSKLYGIVLGGDGSNGGFGNNKQLSNITIFTEEGKSVSYDLDFDSNSPVTSIGDNGTVKPGQLISYKLNKDGEIKWIDNNYDVELSDVEETSGSAKVEIDDNKYIGKSGEVFTSNPVIFEVSFDGDDYDATIVTKSSFLAEDDYELEDQTSDNGSLTIDKYFTAFYNNTTAKEIKVLAYTEASEGSYSYGIADGAAFTNDDHDNGGILLAGEEETYDIAFKDSSNNAYGDSNLTLEKVTDKDLVIYKKSGDTLNVYMVLADKTGLSGKTVTVDGIASGRLTLNATPTVKATDLKKSEVVGKSATYDSKTVKTDEDTVVYVLGKDGYELGSVEDSLYTGAEVYVVIVDKDGDADLIIVDEYNI